MNYLPIGRILEKSSPDILGRGLKPRIHKGKAYSKPITNWTADIARGNARSDLTKELETLYPALNPYHKMKTPKRYNELFDMDDCFNRFFQTE